MSGFGPFDVSPLVERIRELVPAFKTVGAAADRASADNTLALPAAFVILAGEDLTTEPFTGYLQHQATARIDVLIGLRHAKVSTRGQAHADLARPLIKDVRAALNGWRPPGPAGAQLEVLRSAGRAQLLQLASAEWWWVDPFICIYRGRTT